MFVPMQSFLHAAACSFKSLIVEQNWNPLLKLSKTIIFNVFGTKKIRI